RRAGSRPPRTSAASSPSWSASRGGTSTARTCASTGAPPTRSPDRRTPLPREVALDLGHDGREPFRPVRTDEPELVKRDVRGEDAARTRLDLRIGRGADEPRRVDLHPGTRVDMRPEVEEDQVDPGVAGARRLPVDDRLDPVTDHQQVPVVPVSVTGVAAAEDGGIGALPDRHDLVEQCRGPTSGGTDRRVLGPELAVADEQRPDDGFGPPS